MLSSKKVAISADFLVQFSGEVSEVRCGSGTAFLHLAVMCCSAPSAQPPRAAPNQVPVQCVHCSRAAPIAAPSVLTPCDAVLPHHFTAAVPHRCTSFPYHCTSTLYRRPDDATLAVVRGVLAAAGEMDAREAGCAEWGGLRGHLTKSFLERLAGLDPQVCAASLCVAALCGLPRSWLLCSQPGCIRNDEGVIDLLSSELACCWL